jgi:hypothetical protein
MRSVLAHTIAFAVLGAAAPAAASVCDAQKLAAVASYAARAAACEAKGLRKGVDADFDCLDKADAALAKAFARAEKRDDCAAPGNVAAFGPQVQISVGDVTGRLRPAAGASKCSARKLGAAGAALRAKLACYARAEKKDAAADPEQCNAKPGAALTRIFATADTKTGCLTTGDAAAVDRLLDLIVQRFVAQNDLSIAFGSPAGFAPLDLFGVVPTPIADEAFLEVETEPFVWNGATWHAVSVSSNGYAVVGGGAQSADNVCCTIPAIPSNARPNNLLAPFWTDLDGTGAPGIYAEVVTDGDNRWQVIEWRVNLFGTASQQRFQLWLGLNGIEDVSFVYDPSHLPAGPVPFVVGAENASGFKGTSLGLNVLPTEDRRIVSTPP